MSEKIIKHLAPEMGPAPLNSGRVVKAEAYDATVEAVQILEASREEARKIVDAAIQERKAVIEAADRKGYEQGLQHWNDAVVEVNAARDRRLADSEPEMIRLAIRIAQKIVGEELRINPEAIVCIARECMQELGRERSLTLRACPRDAGILRQRIDLLRAVAGPHRSIEVVADSAVGAGGCMVESEYGVIDARLETQIQCLEKILLRAAGQ